MNEEKIKRKYCYVMRPREYGMSGCSCGNEDPDWSEFVHHLWCSRCQKDFIPEDSGLFDGPIGLQVCSLLGISFDMFEISTGKVLAAGTKEWEEAGL